MDKKKILIIAGVVTVVGVGLYMWNKSKKDTQVGEEGGSEGSLDVSNASTTRIMETLPEITESTKGGSSGTNIKDLKGKDKREFRKETRDICKEKYGSGKDYRQCKSRVKSGGVAFTGDFYDSNTEYLDFEGNFDNEFVFKEFDNGLNLDL